MTGKVNKLGSMPMGRLVMNISLPLMVSMLVQSMYNIVDGIYVSRISERALAATSLAYPMQLLMIAVSVGTGVGVNALLSRRLGQRDMKAVSAVATNGLMLSVISALIFAALGLTCIKPFFRIFTSDTELMAMGEEYLSVCMLFSMGIFLATMGERLLQSTGNTMLSMIAQSLGAVVNIVLDPIFIFGYFGFPAMGVTGAAVATVVGQWAAALAALWLNHIKNKEVRFAFRGFRPDFKTIGGIYKIGLPTMVVQTTSSLMMVGMNRLLAASSSAVALFGVYYKLQNFVYMPVSGLAQGLIPIMGFNLGANNGARVISAYKVAIIASAAIMAAGTLIFELFPEQLLGMYDAGGEMLRMGVPALRIIALTFIPMSVTVVTGFACAGLGEGYVNMINALIRQLAVLLPCAYLLMNVGGTDAVWYAFWISELAAMVSAVLFARREYCGKIRAMATN